MAENLPEKMLADGAKAAGKKKANLKDLGAVFVEFVRMMWMEDKENWVFCEGNMWRIWDIGNRGFQWVLNGLEVLKRIAYWKEEIGCEEIW